MADKQVVHGSGPVVIMTAVDDKITRRSADAAGCIAYLQKPSAAGLLLAAIAKATQPTR
jgi:CheY-like chemotaxis protein